MKDDPKAYRIGYSIGYLLVAVLTMGALALCGIVVAGVWNALGLVPIDAPTGALISAVLLTIGYARAKERA